jgi:aminoglycoside phosphotransferase (APT) family kinase protein
MGEPAPVGNSTPAAAMLQMGRPAPARDNILFRLGAELVVRMPRRAAAVRILAHEQRWLPVLAPRLPLPVPAPVRTGQPGFGYPWPWSIVPFLPGQTAAQSPPDDKRDAAVTLGRFLRALHAPAAPGAPINPFRGVPLADRAAAFTQNLRAVSGLVDRAAVLRVWDTAIAAPVWGGPPVWLHGDFHPANILVHQGRISGVIDFGDITSGDPAADLSVAWMLLPGECHDAFRNSYRAAGGRAAGGAIWARARGWALALALAFLAHSADNPMIAGIGRRTIRAALA